MNSTEKAVFIDKYKQLFLGYGLSLLSVSGNRTIKDSPYKENYNVVVNSAVGDYRRKAAINFVKACKYPIIEKRIPCDKTRPVITIDLDSHRMVLNFKDCHEKGSNDGWSQKDTDQSEWTMARYLESYLKYNYGKKSPRDLKWEFNDFSKSFDKCDEDWIESFKCEARAIRKLLDPKKTYRVSRKEKSVDSPRRITPYTALHNSIKKRSKDSFKNTGGMGNWNPVDIFIVSIEDEKEVMESLKSLGETGTTIQTFKDTLRQLMNEKKLFLISLKKASSYSKVQVEWTNMTDSVVEDDYILKDIKLPILSLTPSEDRGHSTSITIKNKKTKKESILDYRMFNSKLNLSMEGRHKDSNARLGKNPLLNAKMADNGINLLSSTEAYFEPQENWQLMENMAYIADELSLPLSIKHNLPTPEKIDRLDYGLKLLKKEIDKEGWESISYSDKICICQYSKVLRLLYLISLYKNKEQLNSLLNFFIRGCEHKGPEFGPFIKVS